MDLEEFFDYKNLLMKDLCSNDKIVKMVTGNEQSAVPNHQLAYTQLFPYELENSSRSAKAVRKTTYRIAGNP